MKRFRIRDSNDGNDIEALAAAWLAQRDEGFSPSQQQEFARWCDADPRHAAAVARLESAWTALQRLRDFRPEAAAHPDRDLLARSHTRPVARFPQIASAVGALAAAGLVIAVLLHWRDSRTDSPNAAALDAQTYSTTAGGYQRVTLPDGSIMELNTNSEAHLAYTAAERRIKLLHGEAHFSVTKNPERPFFVEAGAVAVRAVGTAFNVRMQRDKIEVLVTEGRVQVDDSPEERQLPTPFPVAHPKATLTAGTRMIVAMERAAAAPVAPLIEKLDPSAIREELAWQGPLLVFVDTPLIDVVAQFNRRNRVQISLGDEALADLPIGGSFRPENLDAFVRLLSSDEDLVIEHPDADHIVVRKRR